MWRRLFWERGFFEHIDSGLKRNYFSGIGYPRVFVDLTDNWEFARVFRLPKIVNESYGLANDSLSEQYFLETDQTETPLLLEEQTAGVVPIELLDVFGSQIEVEAFTTVSLSEWKASADGSKSEGEWSGSVGRMVGGGEAGNCDF